MFGYPWGGEAPVMRDVMQRYGRPDALLLLFDADGSVQAYRGGRQPVAADALGAPASGGVPNA